MKVNAIIYKQDVPTIYNKGTEYESSCDTFLATFVPGSFADAVAYANYLNDQKPEFLKNGEIADCEHRIYSAIEEEI